VNLTDGNTSKVGLAVGSVNYSLGSVLIGNQLHIISGDRFEEGRTSTVHDVVISQLNMDEGKVTRSRSIKSADNSELRRVNDIAQLPNDELDVFGSVSSGVSAVDRPIRCRVGKQQNSCFEIGMASKIQDNYAEPERRGGRLLAAIGNTVDPGKSVLFFSEGYQGNNVFARANWTVRSLSVGIETDLPAAIQSKNLSFKLFSTDSSQTNTQELIAAFGATLQNAKAVEDWSTGKLVLADTKALQTLKDLMPLHRKLLEIEHLPEALPILEESGFTAQDKLKTESEIAESKVPGTQLQQIVTRVAVLAIFAYLLHLLVVRQRIQQVLEEHNEARYHAIKLLASRSDRPADSSAQAKLLQELVTFADASLRIPPNPPAPPMSKLAEAIKTTVEKAAAK
jgi:hypothetical protein